MGKETAKDQETEGSKLNITRHSGNSQEKNRSRTQERKGSQKKYNK